MRVHTWNKHGVLSRNENGKNKNKGQGGPVRIKKEFQQFRPVVKMEEESSVPEWQFVEGSLEQWQSNDNLPTVVCKKEVNADATTVHHSHSLELQEQEGLLDGVGIEIVIGDDDEERGGSTMEETVLTQIPIRALVDILSKQLDHLEAGDEDQANVTLKFSKSELRKALKCQCKGHL